jgi:23S rRNA (uridine2552-2'-O)-methyltransferase
MTKKWKRKKAEVDPFYRLAKEKGLRSRAYFKLRDIDRRYNIFRIGDKVLDLGAYPGGWLQYISDTVGIDGLVVGVDIKYIEPIDNALNIQYVQGDIFEEETISKVGDIIGEDKFDVIVSDVSPNISGIWELDTIKIYESNLQVLKYVRKFLREGGILILKTFEGKYTSKLLTKLKREFRIIKLYKPRASRKRSAETYFICISYHPRPRKTSSKTDNEASVFIENPEK